MATTWQKIQIVCPKCNGDKQIGSRSGTVEPDFYVVSQCDLCKGKGFIPWGRLKVEQEAE
jgi:DnaJ-class molecular chaperone